MIGNSFLMNSFCGCISQRIFLSKKVFKNKIFYTFVIVHPSLRKRNWILQIIFYNPINPIRLLFFDSDFLHCYD